MKLSFEIKNYESHKDNQIGASDFYKLKKKFFILSGQIYILINYNIPFF